MFLLVTRFGKGIINYFKDIIQLLFEYVNVCAFMCGYGVVCERGKSLPWSTCEGQRRASGCPPLPMSSYLFWEKLGILLSLPLILI